MPGKRRRDSRTGSLSPLCTCNVLLCPSCSFSKNATDFAPPSAPTIFLLCTSDNNLQHLLSCWCCWCCCHMAGASATHTGGGMNRVPCVTDATQHRREEHKTFEVTITFGRSAPFKSTSIESIETPRGESVRVHNEGPTKTGQTAVGELLIQFDLRQHSTTAVMFRKGICTHW